ncbi:hypothetical protein H9L21_07305 [Aeromicrobium senzhongii]|uniref:DUF3017 domain-containing protein n=1 Tax=Aeromicrobium senzhongii TaxID=2663859 RepID=A0ABX6SWW9_9ACTN|nr:hypothetical protein [Aeromicrobium senzhongii]MTB87227.1 hypothetical protein [Aeromicrobium senzhongii]QNL95702.1 hypothetical protein H9L21_07305 [Aeromicrobium senzhongii]
MHDSEEDRGDTHRRGVRFDEGWHLFASGFGSVVLASVCALLAGPFFELALGSALVALALFVFWTMSPQRHGWDRGSARQLMTWLLGALLGAAVVWYLFFMPDF